jgi:hypothetical protein
MFFPPLIFESLPSEANSFPKGGLFFPFGMKNEKTA